MTANIEPLFIQAQEALAGRYSSEQALGEGRMGVVYLARDIRLDRPVAVKVLRPELEADRETRERFIREAHRGSTLPPKHRFGPHR